MAYHRRTSDPNAVCPEDMYSREELARMDEIACLEEQIDAIDRELQRLDDAFNGADMAGDFRQCSEIENRMEVLIELQCDLYSELHSLETPD